MFRELKMEKGGWGRGYSGAPILTWIWCVWAGHFSPAATVRLRAASKCEMRLTSVLEANYDHLTQGRCLHGVVDWICFPLQGAQHKLSSVWVPTSLWDSSLSPRDNWNGKALKLEMCFYSCAHCLTYIKKIVCFKPPMQCFLWIIWNRHRISNASVLFDVF